MDWPEPIRKIAAFGAILVFDLSFFQPECAIESLGGDAFFGTRMVLLCTPFLLTLTFYLAYVIFKSVGESAKIKNNWDEMTKQTLINCGTKNPTAEEIAHHRWVEIQKMFAFKRLLYYEDNLRRDYFFRAWFTLIDYLYGMGVYQSLSIFLCNDLEDGTSVMRFAPWETCWSDKYKAWLTPFVLFYILYGLVLPFGFFYHMWKNMETVLNDRDEETSQFFRRWGYEYMWKKKEYWWYWFVDKMRYQLSIIIACVFKKYDGYQMMMAMTLMFIVSLTNCYFRPGGWEFYNIQLDCYGGVLFLTLMSGIYFDTLKFWVPEWQNAYDFMAWTFVTVITITILVLTYLSALEVYWYYFAGHDEEQGAKDLDTEMKPVATGVNDHVNGSDDESKSFPWVGDEVANEMSK